MPQVAHYTMAAPSHSLWLTCSSTFLGFSCLLILGFLGFFLNLVLGLLGLFFLWRRILFFSFSWNNERSTSFSSSSTLIWSDMRMAPLESALSQAIFTSFSSTKHMVLPHSMYLQPALRCGIDQVCIWDIVYMHWVEVYSTQEVKNRGSWGLNFAPSRRSSLMKYLRKTPKI